MAVNCCINCNCTNCLQRFNYVDLDFAYYRVQSRTMAPFEEALWEIAWRQTAAVAAIEAAATGEIEPLALFSSVVVQLSAPYGGSTGS